MASFNDNHGKRNEQDVRKPITRASRIGAAVLGVIAVLIVISPAAVPVILTMMH